MANKRLTSYSIPKDLYAPMKLFGVKVSSLLLIIGEPIFIVQFFQQFFPTTRIIHFILFVILNLFMMIWLMMPFNGKTNLYALILFIRTRRKKYYSFERQRKKLQK